MNLGLVKTKLPKKELPNNSCLKQIYKLSFSKIKDKYMLTDEKKNAYGFYKIYINMNRNMV